MIVHVLRCVLCRVFGGGYTKFMACVSVPFVLPCLEANCKLPTAESKRREHWYAGIHCACVTRKQYSNFLFMNMLRNQLLV